MLFIYKSQILPCNQHIIYYNYCTHLEKLSWLINYITFARKLVNSFFII